MFLLEIVAFKNLVCYTSCFNISLVFSTLNQFLCILQISRPGEESPPLLQLPHAHETEEPSPLVTCSRHMCPISVHWHVKQSYKEYWRVKITITNYNCVKNYSYWTLVVQHPNLQSLTQLFSFNYHPLNQYGTISKLNKPKVP